MKRDKLNCKRWFAAVAAYKHKRHTCITCLYAFDKICPLENERKNEAVVEDANREMFGDYCIDDLGDN